MGKCPRCGKTLEAHATVGGNEELKVGDLSICIGCATPLILVALPYEFRVLMSRFWLELDPDTKLLLAKAQEKILVENASSQSPHR